MPSLDIPALPALSQQSVRCTQWLRIRPPSPDQEIVLENHGAGREGRARREQIDLDQR